MSDSLEFRILKYIVAVAETSNFTRAAERLFLAQPSLSKQIRDLEEEIKFPIFSEVGTVFALRTLERWSLPMPRRHLEQGTN